ncbi:ATP-binding protein [Kitasatospora sp. NPDC056446]|uniref:HD domain-containing protein n=1 Tax=Kitasatospora sp. NPDC056446 TaxID=3345819 RepID=UPI0036A7926E
MADSANTADSTADDTANGRADGTADSAVHNALHGPVHGNAVQAGRIGTLYLGTPPPSVTDEDDPWVRAAADARAWRHVRSDRDAEPYRRAALDAVRALAGLRDTLDRPDDPWQDPGIAARFASRVDWLLGDDPPDLYPAEAALLAVLPYLYRVRSLGLAAARSGVRPADLRPAAAPDADRAAYEQFIESHDLLAHRARSRPDAAAPLGWWLYHRWLDQHEDLADPDGVRGLLDRLPALAGLGETFAPRRVRALLHGLRRGPDVTNRDYLAGLSADDHLRAPGEQHVRERWLALLLALAYGTAIETTALPDIVAEHLGIPHQVDLAELRRTLDEAVWGGSYDLPVLRAECHHEAVVEGLREYTTRADALLHAVRRELVGHSLPTRLGSDGAAPAAGAFTGWARFCLDERRMRSMVMGVELYRDRDLAVREIYQNGLDACRYQRARVQYLDRSRTFRLGEISYEGRIEFRQGVDGSGRAYLECQDNGVGMGEAELRGVFSHAGARFAEQLDFRLEHAKWRRADPPVEFHPNSRFGIGVFSYFMLADEIRVTTCRMDVEGRLGPELEVAIHGPNHLFRIVETAPEGREPGTTVRLYLRDDIDLDESWSCLDALERLLGIAEFRTTARHGERETVWEPGVLGPRGKASWRERFGIVVEGPLDPWRSAPPGADVIWCAGGGALLVDGLLVEPDVVKGVHAQAGGGFAGVVVNLSGPLAPGRLSLDRRRVIDDVSETVGGLLREAAREFVRPGSALFGMEWVRDAARESFALADLVAAEAIRQERRYDCGGVGFDSGRTGFFLEDPRILGSVGRAGADAPAGPSGFERKVFGLPDHVLLWRLMAHGPGELLADLGRLCPELPRRGPVRAALPSDIAVLATRARPGAPWEWVSLVKDDQAPDQIARELAVTVEEARRRAAELHVFPRHEVMAWITPDDAGPVTVRELLSEAEIRDGSIAGAAASMSEKGREVPAEALEAALVIESDPVFLWRSSPRRFGRLLPDPDVEPGYLAHASRLLERSVPRVCEDLRRHGFSADPTGLPDLPPGDLVILLSRQLDGFGPWLRRSEPVSATHLIRAGATLDLETAEVVDTLRGIGFRTEPEGGPGEHEAVAFSELFDLAESMDVSPGAVVERYRALGVRLPIEWPAEPTRLDRALFTHDGPLDWRHLVVGERVPFDRLIVASASLSSSPGELARHLHSRGIPTSCDDLPEGLTLHEAMQLFRGHLLPDSALSRSGKPSLVELVETSQRTGHPVTRILSWFGQWGVDVSDTAETIRAALARVPMAGPS